MSTLKADGTNFFKVTFNLPTLPTAFDFKSKITVADFSPLKYHFVRLLESGRSAASIKQKTQQFSCQMVLLDFLRAVTECWIVSLSQIGYKTSKWAYDLDSRSRFYNLPAFKELSKIARDLELAFQYTMDTALVSLGSEDAAVRSQLKIIELEAHAKLRAIKNKVDDCLGALDSVSAVKKTLVEEDQARSVKRLTLLAAIFLPISLAASLLSMGSRVTDLGIIWYDYVGVCSLLLLVMFFVYQIMHALDSFNAHMATTLGKYRDQVKKRMPRRLWNKAVSIIKSINNKTVYIDRGMGWRFSRRMIYSGFWLTFVISFWLGMFKDLDLGLSVLKYGAAGWAGLLVLSLAVEACVFVWLPSRA